VNSSKYISDRKVSLRSKELKYGKELLLNHYRKSVRNFMRLQDMYG